MAKKKPTPAPATGLGKQRNIGKRIVPPIPFEPEDYALIKSVCLTLRVPVAQFIRHAAIKEAKEARAMIERERAKEQGGK